MTALASVREFMRDPFAWSGTQHRRVDGEVHAVIGLRPLRRLLTERVGADIADLPFAGYFARITRTSHCSHDALVLPVFVE